MSEYGELKSLIEKTDKKVDRLLSWAEGDEKLGTPSIAQQIQEGREESREARKMGYENREEINLVKKDVKMKSGKTGAATGGFVAVVMEIIKSLFT